MRAITAICASAFALLVAASTLTGCADRAQFTYKDLGRELSSADVRRVYVDIAKPPFLGTPVTEAPELRQSALISLREKGAAQSDLANLLTEMFPQDSRSVPYYAEAAGVDGKNAWIVLEIWGPEGGNLDNGRMWVFDRDSKEVMTSTTYRLQ